MDRSRIRKGVIGLVGLMVVGFVVIQILPVGRFIPVLQRVDNPPVETDIQWDSPETERLTRMACYDCHSNETVWPWYSNIAPVSWLVTRDVNKGRRAMNFSTETADQMDTDDMEGHINYDMPPKIYLIMHPEASLSDMQKEQLITGLRATFGSDGHSDMDMDMSEGS